jgi:formate dehydrogenase major subunit
LSDKLPFAFREWPVVRLVAAASRLDRLGLGKSVQSQKTASWRPRTETADRVVDSICPYCAVGCGQRVFVKNERVTQIEGDPNSPISRGRLCPKGAASLSLVNSPARLRTVRYRRPGGRQWEDLPLDSAIEMIADRVLATRAASWQDKDEQGRALNRAMGIASLGGATLDNEENHLIKKLFTALGVVQVENQARI